jgi:TolB-like protein
VAVDPHQHGLPSHFVRGFVEDVVTELSRLSTLEFDPL